jgi:hypothetical protein
MPSRIEIILKAVMCRSRRLLPEGSLAVRRRNMCRAVSSMGFFDDDDSIV